MEVKLEDIIKHIAFREKVNTTALSDIVFTENGEPVDIDKRLVDEFRFIGLNNIDFILTGFYKDGFED